jgi:hypothetical protein
MRFKVGHHFIGDEAVSEHAQAGLDIGVPARLDQALEVLFQRGLSDRLTIDADEQCFGTTVCGIALVDLPDVFLARNQVTLDDRGVAQGDWEAAQRRDSPATFLGRDNQALSLQYGSTLSQRHLDHLRGSKARALHDPHHEAAPGANVLQLRRQSLRPL